MSRGGGGGRVGVPVSSIHLLRGEVHHAQVASPSQAITETQGTNKHAHTYSYLLAI